MLGIALDTRVPSRSVLLALAFAVMVPSLAGAQSIAGVVRDSSGAVLPGVTVEAASPALIEKTRSVVTDAGGQYKLENLRPGTYTLTFTLPGFNTVKREGIELTGSFTATINPKRAPPKPRRCSRNIRTFAESFHRRPWALPPVRRWLNRRARLRRSWSPALARPTRCGGLFRTAR